MSEPNLALPWPRAPRIRPLPRTWLQWLLGGLTVLAGLYLTLAIYAAGRPLVALGGLAVLSLSVWTFTSSRLYAYRYLFPGIVATLLFVVFPILYTFAIGFTNFSAKNLLSFERATHYLLEETVPAEGAEYAFSLHASGDRHWIRLEHPENGQVFVTEPVTLHNPPAMPLRAKAGDATAPAVDIKTLVQLQTALKKLVVTLPDGQEMRLNGLRRFTVARRAYRQDGDALVHVVSGDVLKPDFRTGFYVNQATGEAVSPGFKVGVGAENFRRIFTDAKFREPFIRIFIWTIVFSALTVFFAFSIGVVLAVLLNWEALKFRSIYRTFLFLPYAVPAFISILVFRGLFNESFGEINLILDGLFGIRPAWSSDPLLAKAMLLIVNTWLGYPYMMVLCMGLIKSIPAELYEASAIAGAGPLTNFFQLTLPLIARPMLPLLVSTFAFNFNNFVLVSLLTGGGPDFLDTKVPAGATDLLVSYTYRVAFVDSGQNFGLAAAISTVIFALVAVMSVFQLKLMKVESAPAR